MNNYIVGQRVALRKITVDDTDLIVKWRNNPKVKENFIYRGTFTHEGHIKWLNEKVATGEVVQFIIEEMTGRPIGSTYLRDINTLSDSAEYGIFIGEDDARGKGYGSEVVKLIIEYGFNELNLHRIMMRAFSTNNASLTACMKAGFQYEGTARDMVFLDEEYKDVVFLSVISDKNRRK